MFFHRKKRTVTNGKNGEEKNLSSTIDEKGQLTMEGKGQLTMNEKGQLTMDGKGQLTMDGQKNSWNNGDDASRSEEQGRQSTKCQLPFSPLKDFHQLSAGFRLPALASVSNSERSVTLRRSLNGQSPIFHRRLSGQGHLSGDFGFNIRRAQLAISSDRSRTVVFAEPSQIRTGPPRPGELVSGLLPGDQLLMVNGKEVATLTREELLSLIQNSGVEVTLLVKTIPEIASFCQRQSTQPVDVGDSIQLAKSTSPTLPHEMIREEEKWWLVHKDGYCGARLIAFEQDGGARIAVAGHELQVDGSDLDRANSTELDRVDDLSRLPFLNETSCIHVIRQRFGAGLVYTEVGASALICSTETADGTVGGPLAMHDKLVSMFRGCRRRQMPAHIYATIQHVYRNMQMNGKSQGIVLSGVSGSGKSVQLRNVAHYVSTVAGWTRSLSFEKLSAALGLLEAFGNCTTKLNKNATRFSMLFALGFDAAAALRACTIETFLLESDRVFTRPECDLNFHIFYYLWEGADEKLRVKLGLNSITDPTPVISPFTSSTDKEAARQGWQRLVSAMITLGISEEQSDVFWFLLAVIFHLSRAEATRSPCQKANFVKAGHAQQAASLLGVSVEDLAQAIFRGKTIETQTVVSNLSRFSMGSRCQDGMEALNSFLAALYRETFSLLVTFINRSIQSQINAVTSWITVIDYPGATFNSGWMKGGVKEQGLNDLVFNYVNERIAEFLYEKTWTEPSELYAREQIAVDLEIPLNGPEMLNRQLDRPPQLLNSADIDLRSEEPRGLLFLLEEESQFPASTDHSFIDRIFVHFPNSQLLHRHAKESCFVVGHSSGINPIVYNASGWIRRSVYSPAAATVLPLLHNSKNPSISLHFTPLALCKSDSSVKLRRATRAIQPDTGTKIGGTAFFSAIRAQVDYMIASMSRCHRVQFVYCLETRCDQPLPSGEPLHVPFVRHQLRSLPIVDALRSSNRGYPERLPFRDFRRRFQCLMANEQDFMHAFDDRSVVASILEKLDIFPHRYRIGISQVLLRSDVLSDLEDARDVTLSGLIVSLQTVCRQALAAQWLTRRRLLERAIRCIQKNGRLYAKVREWGWWRLYVRVLPLIAAAKGDGDLQNIRERCTRLESENALLRQKVTVSDSRIVDLEAELSALQAATHTSLMTAEREADTRQILETRLLQMQQQLQKQENGQLSSSKSSINGSQSNGNGDVNKTEEGLRRELDEQLAEATRQKLRAQKLIDQMRDFEAEMQRLKSQNESLEKKQRRVDHEIKGFRDMADEQRIAKERFLKEKDDLANWNSRLKNEIENIRMENTELRSQTIKLRGDLEESIRAGGTEAELANALRQRRLLEAKVADQEEEMDELAGKAQLLEQTVTRLEMTAERLRTETNRDVESKEAELVDLRAQHQRRFRAFEEQLADQAEANASLLKQNRMLEGRLRTINAEQHSMETADTQLKRDLRRAMALQRDTQTVLAHERENAPNAALLESALVSKNQAEEKALTLLKEKNAASALVEEHDEQLKALLKKFKAQVQQSAVDAITLNDQIEQIAELEKTKQRLNEQLGEAIGQRDFVQAHSVDKHKLQLAEQKIRDLEGKLQVEMGHKQRLDTICNKQREELEAAHREISEAQSARDREMEASRRLKKEIAGYRDDLQSLRRREAEITQKLNEQTQQAEQRNQEHTAVVADLKLAMRRIEGLQQALQEDLQAAESDSESITNGSVTGMSML